MFRHFLLEHQTVGDKRRKRRKSSSVSSARASGGDSDAEDNADPTLHYDNRGLTKQVRHELLLLNPLLDAKGKRKSKTNVARGARPPVITLAVSSRVRLLDKMAFHLGLIPGATGTVIGFVYTTGPEYGPLLPGADLAGAVASDEQPQVPMVLVQFDERYYSGESCHPSIPCVVPIYPKTSTIEHNGQKYAREQLPLEPANASTVHQAQGTSAKEHVMCPPGAPNADFTRALFYVALSRCETLKDLYFILYKATAKMFTKHKSQVAEIESEYVRLRQLPKWHDALGAPSSPDPTERVAEGLGAGAAERVVACDAPSSPDPMKRVAEGLGAGAAECVVAVAMELPTSIDSEVNEIRES